ncbi:hypothetical protein TL16_g06119 [Triparma laevis f. inornata]|uniref:molybdopterin adenylyltransferase n=1 Tax=Triparma laevis f. inornata TaxID=1714386 RepID=A0A9W7ANL2_9STRA|nr:hypothetical protein TL16_g06119 [Triparma laevis f. inornata]
MIPVSDCLSHVLTSATSLPLSTKIIPLLDSINSYSSADVSSSASHPPFRSSIVDGYALPSLDCSRVYAVDKGAKVYAGDDGSGGGVNNNSNSDMACVYVTTGAIVPDGYVAVVNVESCVVKDGGSSLTVSPAFSLPANNNIRPVGCDIPPDVRILRRGQRITPEVVGVLASIGEKEVEVFAQPRVGVVSTGNELVDVSSGEGLAGGKIYDANRYTLLGLVKEFGGEGVDFGIVCDSKESVGEALKKAMLECDVVITSGGVSMGEKDYLAPVMRELGVDIKFDRMYMKPGKPTTFGVGEIEGRKKLIFALPGNPGVKLDKIRPEYHRVIVRYGGGGSGGGFRASSTGAQRSSRLMSMVDGDGETSNGLALLPSAEEAGRRIIEDGEEVEILLTGKVLGVQEEKEEGGEDVTIIMVGGEGEKDVGRAKRVLEGGRDVFGFKAKTYIFALGEEGAVEAAIKSEELEWEGAGKLVLVVHFKKFCDKVVRRVGEMVEKRAENMEATIGRIGCGIMGGTFSFYELYCGSRGGMMLVCLGAGGEGGGEKEKWKKLLKEVKKIVKRPRDLIKEDGSGGSGGGGSR